VGLLADDQSAAATLQTPTVGYHATYDVYYDTAFSSFAFAPPPLSSINETSEAMVVGHVTDAKGLPVAGRAVNFYFADGSVRTVGTRADGGYRLAGAPEGEAIVEAGGETRELVIAAHGETAADVTGVNAERGRE
jgi:prepilin-type processing-associated H-X9-DG protein